MCSEHCVLQIKLNKCIYPLVRKWCQNLERLMVTLVAGLQCSKYGWKVRLLACIFFLSSFFFLLYANIKSQLNCDMLKFGQLNQAQKKLPLDALGMQPIRENKCVRKAGQHPVQYQLKISKVVCSGVGLLVNNCCLFSSKILLISNSTAILAVLNCGSWITWSPLPPQCGWFGRYFLYWLKWLWMGGVQNPFHESGFWQNDCLTSAWADINWIFSFGCCLAPNPMQRMNQCGVWSPLQVISLILFCFFVLRKRQRSIGTVKGPGCACACEPRGLCDVIQGSVLCVFPLYIIEAQQTIVPPLYET